MLVPLFPPFSTFRPFFFISFSPPGPFRLVKFPFVATPLLMLFNRWSFYQVSLSIFEKSLFPPSFCCFIFPCLLPLDFLPNNTPELQVLKFLFRRPATVPPDDPPFPPTCCEYPCRPLPPPSPPRRSFLVYHHGYVEESPHFALQFFCICTHALLSQLLQSVFFATFLLVFFETFPPQLNLPEILIAHLEFSLRHTWLKARNTKPQDHLSPLLATSSRFQIFSVQHTQNYYQSLRTSPFFCNGVIPFEDSLSSVPPRGPAPIPSLTRDNVPSLSLLHHPRALPPEALSPLLLNCS